MTDDEKLQAITETVAAEFRAIGERMLTIMEQLMKRIEVLELEAQHQRPAREA